MGHYQQQEHDALRAVGTYAFIHSFRRILSSPIPFRRLRRRLLRYRMERIKSQVSDEVTPYPCACCGYLTRIGERWCSRICKICGWQECNIQETMPYYRGGPNRPSLQVARRNYFKTGASTAHRSKFRRPPLASEVPPGGNPYKAKYAAHRASFPCPCCQFLTFESPAHNTLFVCPVCLWTDEIPRIQSKDDEDYLPDSNDVTLEEARSNFKQFQASDQKYIAYAREPRQDEIP